MINQGKHPILGVNVDAIDYEYAVKRIVEAAVEREPLAVSALEVQGVMTGFHNPIHRRRLNGLDLVTPDGQPVRWALNWLHRQGLAERVNGPELMMRTAKALADRGLSVYLYGSKKEVLERMGEKLRERFPKLLIAGMEASKFRPLSTDEKTAVVERIWISGASTVFVGLGYPRQEVWAFEYRDLLGIPILAVGAGFDANVGAAAPVPKAAEDRGREQVFAFFQEPTRLWKRYLGLNPSFLWNVMLQLLNIRNESAHPPDGTEPIESFG